MKNIIIAFLVLLPNLLIAQNKFESEIIKSSQTMGDALLKYDYQILAEYTYPLIIEMMGGKTKMIQITENAMEQIKQQGFEFSKINIGKPGKVHQAGEELHCLLPQTIELKNQDGTIINTSYLIGISLDKGEKWYFIDTAGLTNESAYELFPDFNSDLTIPPKTQPEFIRN